MEPDLSLYSAIVVDDEPLSRVHLAHVLREAGVGDVLEVSSGVECLHIFEHASKPPDWAFLDVHMPGMDGLALADALQSEGFRYSVPAIVFVTGYEDYAIPAFERAAVDYLLKPAARDRVAVTLARLAERGMLRADRPPTSSGLPTPALQRLPIRLDYAVRLIDVQHIIGATARDKRVDVITAGEVYTTYYTLNQLEQRLPEAMFLRVHESWIVNLAEVLEIHNLGSQSYQIRLKTDGHPVPVSRRRYSLLQQRLGL